MTMLALFGAGASYDSIDVDSALSATRTDLREWRPPTVNELFQPRDTFGSIMERSWFKPAIPLVVDLRRRLTARGTSLEHELDLIQGQADDGDEPAARGLMALRFYLLELLTHSSREWPRSGFGTTNYHWLVDRLDRWARLSGEPVLYVTFNYDALLERAIADVHDWSFTSLDRYTSHGSSW